MKSTLLTNLVCFLLLSGCVSQSELTSLDTRLNELEIRNAEAQKNSQALKSGLNNREDEEQALRHQAASLRAKMDALNEEWFGRTTDEIEAELPELGDGAYATPDLGTEDNPIKVLFVPSVNVDVMIESGDAIEEFLNEATGLVYEVSVPTSYAATLEEMCASPDDTIGFIPAMGYALANSLCGVQPGLASVRYGWNVYWAQYLVARDSEYETLEDLEGATWGLGEFTSTSGYLYPQALYADLGITVGETIEAGGHPQAVKAGGIGCFADLCQGWTSILRVAWPVKLNDL